MEQSIRFIRFNDNSLLTFAPDIQNYATCRGYNPLISPWTDCDKRIRRIIKTPSLRAKYEIVPSSIVTFSLDEYGHNQYFFNWLEANKITRLTEINKRTIDMYTFKAAQAIISNMLKQDLDIEPIRESYYSFKVHYSPKYRDNRPPFQSMIKGS